MKNLSKQESLIPLMWDGDKEQVIKLLDMGYFDPEEKTSKGSNLLTFALYLGHFEIVDKLLSFNTKEKNYFPFQITENSQVFFEQMIQDNSTFNNYYSFFKKHNIILNLDLKDVINTIKDSTTEIFSDTTNIKKLKILLSNSSESIKLLDPFETIQKISKINSPELMALYFDICEFDKLPLQKHPAFMLLKDVATNPTKYYDFYVFSKNEDVQNLDYNINKIAIKKIEKNLKSVKNATDFYEYFKNKDGFLFDISNLQNESICDEKKMWLKFTQIYSAQIEINHIYQAMKKVNEECNLRNQNNFLTHYLTHWTTSYFNSKIMHTNIQDNTEKYRKMFDKYQFEHLFIIKDSDTDKIVASVNDAAKELKQLFNLEDSMIGFKTQLWFNNISTDGKHQAGNNKMQISNQLTKYDTTSAIIHEYTHNMQAYDAKNEVFTKIQEVSKKWVNYPAKHFSQYLTGQILEYKEEIHNITGFTSMIEKAIKDCDNMPSAVKTIERDCKSFFNDDYSSQNFIDNTLNHFYINDLIDLYYHSQKKKDYSYDYHVWKKRDEYIKEDPNSKNIFHPDNQFEYWLAPKEIHARINQSLYEEKIKNTYITMNPAKLEQMKKIIVDCNEQLSTAFKSKIAKGNVLSNMRQFKDKTVMKKNALSQ